MEDNKETKWYEDVLILLFYMALLFSIILLLKL